MFWVYQESALQSLSSPKMLMPFTIATQSGGPFPVRIARKLPLFERRPAPTLRVGGCILHQVSSPSCRNRSRLLLQTFSHFIPLPAIILYQNSDDVYYSLHYSAPYISTVMLLPNVVVLLASLVPGSLETSALRPVLKFKRPSTIV